MAGLVIQEWMESIGGAERVVKTILKEYPDSNLFSLWSDDNSNGNTNIMESWIAKTPLRKSKPLALPLMPLTWKRTTFGERPDWVFISSHLFGHHASLNPELRDLPGLSYIHSPARYIWEPSLDNRAKNRILQLALPTLRKIDRQASQASNFKLIANSKNIKQRIKRCWGLESEVIYPPVRVRVLAELAASELTDTSKVRSIISNLPAQFVLGVGRFVGYKKLDEIIRFASRVSMPAVLIGQGPLEARYRQLASELGVHLTILSDLSDLEVARVMKAALTLVFPGEEDFGIVPVEAISLGTPVLALGAGGALETIDPGKNGVLVDDFGSLQGEQVLEKLLTFDKTEMLQSVAKFDEIRFRSEIARTLAGIL